MNHERETLSRQLEDLRQKIAEASQQSYDQEMSVTKSMDRFEQLLGDYTSLGHQIGTIPPISEGPLLGRDGTDYSIDIDLGAEDANEVANAGKRLRAEIWPALVTYGEGFRRQMVERQKEEAANVDMRLGVINSQADNAKTVSVSLAYNVVS
jgi:kinetochore protein NDC80